MAMSVDDLLNGAAASPYLAPPLSSGNTPVTANGAGNMSSTTKQGGASGLGRMYASSNSAIVLVWLILLVLLILSHTFTFSLQE